MRVGIVLMLLVAILSACTEEPTGVGESAITISGVVTRQRDQAPVEGVLVRHQFYGPGEGWTDFNTAFTDAAGTYTTGEPQTASPSGRFCFEKAGFDTLRLDASEARRVGKHDFRLDAVLRERQGSRSQILPAR